MAGGKRDSGVLSSELRPSGLCSYSASEISACFSASVRFGVVVGLLENRGNWLCL